MILLDYFLYDNRTWSPQWGRDWGLKAATGALAGRADLKTAFDRYCGIMPSDQGRLQGFSEAIGGVRPPKGDGYLLCVAFESSDSFGRPTWVVVGIWCPDSEKLEQLLRTGDPINSARALIGSETLPDTIEIRPVKSAVRPRPRRTSTEPVFCRFEQKSTVRDVVSLLLGAVQSSDRLPSVLGVTATSRLTGITGFDWVYCFPMDERTERALVRVLSPEPEDVPIPLVEATKVPVLNSPRPTIETLHPERKFSVLAPLLVGLLISAGMLVAGVLAMDYLSYSASDTSGVPASSLEQEEVFKGEASPAELLTSEERSEEEVLKEIQEQLEELKSLNPEDLLQRLSFQAAKNLDVLPEYQENRKQVRDAFAALFEVRSRMIGPRGNYVAYYYDDDGRNINSSMKLRKIAEILVDAPLGGKHCEILEEAFGFEFENGNSVVRMWCKSLAKLEDTSRKLSFFLGQRGSTATHHKREDHDSKRDK